MYINKDMDFFVPSRRQKNKSSENLNLKALLQGDCPGMDLLNGDGTQRNREKTGVT